VCHITCKKQVKIVSVEIWKRREFEKRGPGVP
jgi:hypothetical protein